MKILTIAITALTLTACVASPQYADSPHLRECNYEATKATAGGTFYGATTTVGAAYAEDALCHKLPDHHNSEGEAWWIDSYVYLWKCVFSPKDA